MLNAIGSRIALPLDHDVILVMAWAYGHLDVYSWSGKGEPPYVHHVGDALSDWFGNLKAADRLEESLTRRLGDRKWRIGASRTYNSGVLRAVARISGEDPRPTIVIAVVDGVLEACGPTEAPLDPDPETEAHP